MHTATSRISSIILVGEVLKRQPIFTFKNIATNVLLIKIIKCLNESAANTKMNHFLLQKVPRFHNELRAILRVFKKGLFFFSTLIRT